ncbi:18657_t:CDS:2, partial [Acaulospora morrowiae]
MSGTQRNSYPDEYDPLLNSRVCFHFIVLINDVMPRHARKRSELNYENPKTLQIQKRRLPYDQESEYNAQRICNILRILAIILVICTFLVLHKSKGSEGYIIYNANIYTADEQYPKIESFVVLDGKFVDIGTKFDLMKKWTNVQYIDLQGRTVVPGLIDAHAHLMQLGDMMNSVDLSGTKSIDEVRERIRAYISMHRDKNEWITGWGWDQTQWSSKLFPTFKDLDSDPELAQYPIALTRIDGHALWVNERILNILRKDKIPDKVDGGEIGKEKGTNQLTGIFIDNAMELVFEKKPLITEEQSLMRIRTAISRMNFHGLTGIHDAGVTPDTLDLYKKIIKTDPEEFNIRNYAMIDCQRNSYCGEKVERIERLGEGRLTVRSVKLFMDGALGSWGA